MRYHCRGNSSEVLSDRSLWHLSRLRVMAIVAEEALPLVLKVRREETGAQAEADFVFREEAATIRFAAGMWRLFGVSGEDVYQLTLHSTFEYVGGNSSSFEVGQPDFFACFTLQGFFDGFAEVHMPTHCGVPPIRLNAFPSGTMLQEDVAALVEDVQMHHRMQQFAAIVAFASGGRTGDASLLIHKWQTFVVVVVHDFSDLQKKQRVTSRQHEEANLMASQCGRTDSDAELRTSGHAFCVTRKGVLML